MSYRECLYHLYWSMYLTDKDRPPSSNSQWDWEKHKDKVSQVLLILASQGERYFYQNNHPIICRPHSQARPLHQELKLPPPRVWPPHIKVCHKIKQTYQKVKQHMCTERLPEAQPIEFLTPLTQFHNIHEPPEGQIGPAIKPNSSCMLLDKMILFGFNILLLNFSLTMPWGPLDCRMFVHPSWELYKVC